ncbi:hypothetical protein ZHAS_00008755 [Anopheles sinensis]|uniref:Uncharacterized protein n=1 Tax=Anopheles sinensis TaxID=74873 RepID=A0A084VT98_ANOSI|nr:hypothetical protein ZHAS_00008755 [Anopheles sinensis]
MPKTSSTFVVYTGEKRRGGIFPFPVPPFSSHRSPVSWSPQPPLPQVRILPGPLGNEMARYVGGLQPVPALEPIRLNI